VTATRSSPLRPDARYHTRVALDERAFFSEKPETRKAKYQCPRCKRSNEYGVRWVRRTKKDRLPGGADEVDRAKFSKLRDYLLRVEDEVTCSSCGKRFEIPSQQSLVFVDQMAGLPNDEELEREIAAASGEPADTPAPAAEVKPAIPARFLRKSTGWK
jgi:DNA-directed RNA polymerase subunit RPC12/RpoP